MADITNHQGNATQNHDEIAPCTCEDGHYVKKQKISSVGQDMENLKPLHTVGGNVNWCSHYGKQHGGSLKN